MKISKLQPALGVEGDGSPLLEVEESDLQWFQDLAPTLPWRKARSYATTIPHEYVFAGRTCPLNRHDFYRIGRVVRTFGQPIKFNGTLGVNLEYGDGWSYFTTDRDTEAVGNIQRGPVTRRYGKQDAPSTINPGVGQFGLTLHDGRSGITDLSRVPQGAGPAHEIANYGRRQPVEAELARSVGTLRSFLETVTGSYSTLDLGCGTGRLLDAQIAPRALYTGVDYSRGMLNELLMKHPRITSLLPMDVTEALATPLISSRQWDVIHARVLPEGGIDQLREMHPRLLIVDTAQVQVVERS